MVNPKYKDFFLRNHTAINAKKGIILSEVLEVIEDSLTNHDANDEYLKKLRDELTEIKEYVSQVRAYIIKKGE